MSIVDDVFSGIKKVRDISQKLHDADLQDIMADLIVKSADLKVEMAQLQLENIQQKQEIQELQQKADFRAKVEFRDGSYYLTEPIQGYAEGPHCSTCLDVDGKLVSKRQTDSGNWYCYYCCDHRGKGR